MPYQVYYNEVTADQIADHAAWYESITIVDKYGNELPLILTDDPFIGEEGDDN